MYISIQLENPKANSRRVSGKERRTGAAGTGTISKRSLVLAVLIAVLLALLAMQAAGVGTRAEVAADQLQAAEAPTEDAAPSTREWVHTSPYAQEPISISGGSGSLQLAR